MRGTYYEFKKGIGYEPGARSVERPMLQGLDWCSLGAIAGLSGGIITALSGSLLTAITWFAATGTGSSYAHTLGTILLFLTIPLLILGAHCLDLSEKQAEKAETIRFTRSS